MPTRFPTVAQYMAVDLHTLSPDDDIFHAIDLFLKERISGAPVVEGDRLVGVLSEKDCLRLVAVGDANDADGVPRGPVRSFMETRVRTVRPGMDIYYVAGVFLRHPYRRLPVVEEGRLVGQISRRDILRAIRENFPAEGTPAP